MNQNNRCPECGTLFDKKIQQCVCGWRSHSSNESAKPDARCAYRFSGRRCPAMGTVSRSIRSSGAWYCSGHSQVLNDPVRAESLLKQIETNYQVKKQKIN